MPAVLYWCPRFTHELYGPRALYITENGLHSDDAPDATGEIKDLYRCQWLHEYGAAMHRACAEGVPLKGYFHWSLFDNFEWQHGYNKRLGLVHVDFATQKRTPKLSASVYRRIMQRNAFV
jgi:beta-glucosidase